MRLLTLLCCLAMGVFALAQPLKPAVLFTGGLHLTYFAQPLHAEGIELHVADADLPAMLTSGKYNVVFITGGFADPKTCAALKAFMEAGGGVIMTPGVQWGLEDYIATQKFLEGFGAHFTMSLMNETDPAKRVRAMFTDLYVADAHAPFNAGVPGLLYLGGGSQSGMSSPVAVVPTDPAWKPVVTASATAKAEGWKANRVKDIIPYVNEAPISAPMLLAVRPVGKGYLAALGITAEWIFAAPANCPPVLDMLSRGREGKPSNWIRLYANLFRTMAEPTLKAGKGGAPTPEKVLQPPPMTATLAGWADEMLKPRDWTKAPAIDDQEQLQGLIGARSSYAGGRATVDEWVKAAKAAKLDYLVFLDPLAATSEENFNKLKADCKRLNDADPTFFACPGIWGQDVRTKTSMYCYGEKIQYPLATILTADKKYFDDTKTWADKEMPTKYIFDYFFEQNGYKGQFGYFRHASNPIPYWEYKMNNTFCVFSTENGKWLDYALEPFQDLQATNFTYNPTCFSLMDDPSQIARALEMDWRVVNVAPGEFGDGTYTAEYGKGASAMRRLYSEQVAWLRPFQYLTQGPTINCWRGRWEIVIPFGEWYRPDQWRYTTRLHASSPAGLKEVKLIAAGKVYARFLLNGAKEFDKTFNFENSQQRVMYPIITDMNGKQAIGSYVRNANTLWNEFICGDRCNFLSYGMVLSKGGKWMQLKPCGNAVTHNKGCWQAELMPSTTLTVDYPTMPIDGAPQGNETPRFPVFAQIATPGFPGSQEINCKPLWGVSGPDILLGGGRPDHVLTDPNSWGNAWSWWSPVKPNPFYTGTGMHGAFSPLPEGIRAGWYEFNLTAAKDLPLTDTTLPITYTYTRFTELHDSAGKVLTPADKPEIVIGPFKTGAYLLVDMPGGPAALYSMCDTLIYRRRGNEVTIGSTVDGDLIPKGAPITMKIGYLGAPGGTDVEAFRHYFSVLGGKLPIQASSAISGDGIAVHADGRTGAVELTFDDLKLNSYLPVIVERLYPNWDAWLVEKTRPAPNWRQIVKDGRTAYAALPTDGRKAYFLGHPVKAGNTDLHITVCNTLPGEWVVTLHNPTDAAIATDIWTPAGWTPFSLPKKACTIPAGSSVDITVKGE